MGKIKKNIIVILLIIVLSSATFLFTGCNEEQKLIVYLGDSIAEAIAGMSPISERENYGYYALIGKRNNYIYRNRSVSGDQSKDLLKLIQEEDSDGMMIQSLLKEADIIHISILGNDFLLNDLGSMIISAAKDNYTFVDNIVKNSTENFAEIISILKSYNEDVLIMVETIYNPVFEYSTLISPYARGELTKMGIDETQYRELAGNLINKLNNIIKDYYKENPNDICLLDVNDVFDKIYQSDNTRGKNLIFSDDIHPSNEGHAVIADTIQTKLEELDLANKKSAVKEYKKIKIEQLERMYCENVDVKSVTKQIKKAESCSEITKIYFAATNGKIPNYC